MNRKLLRQALADFFLRFKRILIVYVLIILGVFSYPYILQYLGVITKGVSIFDQLTVTIIIAISIVTIFLSQPFFAKYFEPRIIVEPFKYLVRMEESPSYFELGWKIRNIGRQSATNVTVTARFILLMPKPEDAIDKEFIIFKQENILSPKAHQPDFKVKMQYKKGEDRFGVLLKTKKFNENTIERLSKWESLPIIRDFECYIVKIALDGQNLREEDRELRKYDVNFAGETPTVKLIEEPIADILKEKGI